MVDTPRFFYLHFGLYSPNQQVHENKRYTIEKPFKIATRNAKKILNFPKFVRFLGHFLKKQCFWKMGVAGIKRLPRPSKTGSFFMDTQWGSTPERFIEKY